MLVAYGDKVIIKPAARDKVSPGGIHIPDIALKAQQLAREGIRGRVVACGGGRTLENGSREEMPVKPGQTVYYPAYGGCEIEFENEKYIVHTQADILAVVK